MSRPYRLNRGVLRRDRFRAIDRWARWIDRCQRLATPGEEPCRWDAGLACAARVWNEDREARHGLRADFVRRAALALLRDGRPHDAKMMLRKLYPSTVRL